MHTHTHVWHDEAKRRHVELTVAYTREDSTIYIERLTPTKVTFLCEHGRPQRTIKVSTPTAQRMLVEAYQRNRTTLKSTLEQSILAANQLA